MRDDTIPQAAMDWIVAVSGGPVVGVRRLAGGTHAATHLVETAGEVGEVVLRRFPVGDQAAAREAEVLGLLDGLGGLVPRLLAADVDGVRFGEPSVLISRLAGEPDISTARPEALGTTLAHLHATPLPATAPSSTGSPSSGTAPVSAKAARSRGAALFGGAADDVLTHFDYWSGNVLWDEGRLTGVVDWSGARAAPRGHDVSWCRLDLALLHGPRMADAFLAAYEDAAGLAVPDRRRWDLIALDNSEDAVETWIANYHDLGRHDLGPADLRRRHIAWRAVVA
jgi:aminoglycoside phosphotransferase (APT) family kinase protein